MLLFWKGKKDWGSTKIGESRLVFAQPKLKDVEARDHLPEQYSGGSTPLENQIEKFKAEAEARRKRNRIGNVLGRVKGEETLEEMTQKLWNCEQFMKSLKAPVENADQFREAFHTTQSFDNALSRLRGQEFDEKDIQNLLDSGLGSFLDHKKLGRFLKAQAKMITAASALSRIHQSDAVELAAQKSREEEAELERTLRLKGRGRKEMVPIGEDAEMEMEEMEIEEAAKRDDYEGHLKLVEREEDEEYLELIKRQMTDKEAYDARHHRYTLWAEQKVTPIVADKLGYEEKLDMANLLLEAREIRLEQMRQYLRKRYDELKAGYGKAQTRFSERDRKILEIIFREGEEWFSNLNTIDAAQDFNRRLDLAEKHLKNSNESLDEVETNRPRIETEIRVHFRDLKTQLTTFTPEHLAALIAQAEKEPIVHVGHAEALKALQDPNSDFWTQVRDFDSRLENLGEMELSELQAARNELKVLERAIGLDNQLGEKIDGALDPERLRASQKARKAIEELKGVTSMTEIQKILNETIGSDHVRLVNHATFEAKYRPYTTTGHMVFYERGEEWAVIVDEEALRDDKNVAMLQKQLTHELLHLEFERNDELKAEWLKTFTAHDDWPQIKQAYVEAFPGKKPAQYEGSDKTAYTADDWKDEDILSELFAMQNTLGDTSRPAKDTPLDRLRSLTLPIAASLGLGVDTARAKEIVRGYDEDDISSAMTEGGESGGKEVSVSAKGSYENYKDEIEEYERNINEILGSEYMGYVPVMAELMRAMRDFNENTKSLNENFKKSGSDFLNALIGDRNKKIKDDLKDIMKNLATVGGEIPNKTMNPFRRIWIRTSFLAITDIFQMIKDVAEYVKRRHERKKEDHAARLGMAVFGNTNLGREFHAREQKAEHAEVEEWKGRYEHLDAWKLYHLIDGMARSPAPDKDQLKAILQILAHKGRINWRHEGLWKVLNKLQSAVHLTPGDPILLHNPPLLRQKLHSATGEIWNDYDFYTGLEKENEDSYDGSKKKFFASLSKIPDQLTDRMEQLYRMDKEGRNVLGSEYEAVIEFSIENGKSYQEAALFYLMAGMAKGIIGPDRALALDDKYLNKFPGTQWIYHKKPPLSKKDYERIAKKYFKKSYETGKVGADFKEFFATQIQNDEMVMQRVQKSVSERGWDHDWTRGIAMGFDAETAKRFLSGKSGQEEAKITGVQNAVAGLLQWFEENSKVADRMDFRRHFSHRMGGIAMMDGIFNDVAFRKAQGHAPYTRMSGSIGNGVARDASVGNHGDWNTFKQLEKTQEFLDLFDKPLFTMLRDKTSARTDPAAHGEKIIAYLKEHYRHDMKKWDEFKELDDVFKDLDTLIKIITSSRYISDTQFLKKIAWLRQGVKEEK